MIKKIVIAATTIVLMTTSLLMLAGCNFNNMPERSDYIGGVLNESVISLPTKRIYEFGEEIELEGMEIKKHYAQGLWNSYSPSENSPWVYTVPALISDNYWNDSLMVEVHSRIGKLVSYEVEVRPPDSRLFDTILRKEILV